MSPVGVAGEDLDGVSEAFRIYRGSAGDPVDRFFLGFFFGEFKIEWEHLEKVVQVPTDSTSTVGQHRLVVGVVGKNFKITKIGHH